MSSALDCGLVFFVLLVVRLFVACCLFVGPVFLLFVLFPFLAGCFLLFFGMLIHSCYLSLSLVQWLSSCPLLFCGLRLSACWFLLTDCFVGFSCYLSAVRYLCSFYCLLIAGCLFGCLFGCFLLIAPWLVFIVCCFAFVC